MFLLMVFAIALTPFGAFHHHEAIPGCSSSQEAKCTHKEHVRNHADTCLVCAAHFEKNFVNTRLTQTTFLQSSPFVSVQVALTVVHIEAEVSLLRGPPENPA